MKDRIHIIISKDVEKAFDKMKHIFMIKIVNKLHIQRTEIKGCLSSSVGQASYLTSALVMILGSWDGTLHWVPVQ